MKVLSYIPLFILLLGCSYPTSQSSVVTEGTLDSTEFLPDTTEGLWTSIIDTIAAIGKRSVTYTMVPGDMQDVMMRGRDLNNERKVRNLYGQWREGDTLFFVQYIQYRSFLTYFAFWGKGGKRFCYRYRHQPLDRPDTVFIRFVDFDYEYDNAFYDACERWDSSYISSECNRHHHRYQYLIYRVAIKKDAKFDIEYLSCYFSGEN